MASRESQGLQIALILFVMVAIVLALTTYLYFRKAEEKTKEAAAARVEAKQFDNAAKQLAFENQVLKHVIGVESKTQAELDAIKQGLGANKDIEKVLTQFEQDMAMYGAGFPGQTLSYQKLPAYLIEQIGDRNQKLVAADAKAKSLQAERDSVEAAEKQRTLAAEAAQAKAQQDLVAEKTRFATDRTEFIAATKKIEAIQPQLQAKINQLDNKMRTEIETRDQALLSLQETFAFTKIKLADALKPQEFERPDGEIIYVNQRANVVWIDLGSADGLQRQMNFSVYDKNQIGATNAEVKAKIQVTAIKEAHLAEARIVESDDLDVIMKGDKIYSPTFRKGHKTRFALAGFMDIDGDGKSDQTKVKSIITTNGGVVDAELLPDGSIAGKLSVETRFLVRGEAPTDKTDERMLNGWNSMQEEATRKGLETMSLQELLDRMGYHDDARVIDLQRGGPGGGGTEKFRKRRPSVAS